MRMNSRERFLAAMRYETSDRVPYFYEGMRSEVLDAWQAQGMQPGSDLKHMFGFDERQEVEPDLEHGLNLIQLAKTADGPARLEQRLDALDPARLPRGWKKQVRLWKNRQHILMLEIHQGLFLTLGIEEWDSFAEAMLLLADDPDFVQQAMMIQARFAARLAERILSEVQVDAAIIGEPIASIHGPLVSPRMYEKLALVSYASLIQALRRCGVETIILRSYANVRPLLPGILRAGFNCLWAYERDHEAMDYLSLRREFGRELRLIGGIDLDVLRQDEGAIHRELERVVPPLLADGGYIPMVDGRVREYIPLANYLYYRRLLEEMTQA
jgi:hypothetical protein